MSSEGAMGAHLPLSLLLTILLYVAVAEPIGPERTGLIQFPPRRIEWPRQRPTVLVALLVRNKAHLLINFLGYLEQLDYPKHRMIVWIHTDHNQDNTSAVLHEWADNARPLYHRIDIISSGEKVYEPVTATGETVMAWSEERYVYMMQLRQKALNAARDQWADFILYVDADNLLINNQTLNKLIEQKKPVVAPMLEVEPNSAYSNFWCGMDENGYYKRTPEYIPTLKRDRKGCFEVVMVHSTMLINLRIEGTRTLQFYPPHPDYTGAMDDILVFADSVKASGLKMYILNDDFYGLMLPTADHFSSLQQESFHFEGLKIKYLVDYGNISYSPHISHEWPPLDNLGFDEVYLISLKRRPDRWERMMRSFSELRLDVKWVAAIDGRNLTDKDKEDLGIKMLPGWQDPYGKREITNGEIGCFLSHYNVWQDVVRRNLGAVAVLEDDCRFEPGFVSNLIALMDEVIANNLSWDLIYLGRKRLEGVENWVPGTTRLVYPNYSYWTVGYLLSLRGAKKLLNQKPLNKILPVDEYLPIMFNNHPEEDWKKHFANRDLVVYSAHPLLLYPTHYVGDEGYFSDTEPPEIWEERHKIRMQEKKKKQREEL